MLVEASVRPALVERLTREITRHYGEDPLASPDLARIVNRPQFERLYGLLEGARQRGQLLAGGQSDRERLRIAPTLLAVEAADDPLMQEELFGPLLPVLPVASLEEAITLVRRGAKPLALYLFSTSSTAQEQVLAGTSSGGVCFNDVVMQVGVPELPFGGVGPSGMGRYHGQSGFDTFSHLRSVLRRPFRFDVPLRYPPYGNRLSLIKRLMG